MIFHNDRCTITREVSSNPSGELIWTIETVAEDIPCHLAVNNFSATDQTQSVAKVLQNYRLHIATSLNVDIQTNDKVEIVTGQGQNLCLYAGEVHKYPVTVQVTLERENIV